jgi:hypothetical protein
MFTVNVDVVDGQINLVSEGATDVARQQAQSAAIASQGFRDEAQQAATDATINGAAQVALAQQAVIDAFAEANRAEFAADSIIEDALPAFIGTGPVVPLATDDVGGLVLSFNLGNGLLEGPGIISPQQVQAQVDTTVAPLALPTFVGSGSTVPIVTDDVGGVIFGFNYLTGRLFGEGLGGDVRIDAPRVPLGYLAAGSSLLAIIYYGQSNAAGVDANPALTTSQPYSNVMFNGGAVPGGGTIASSTPADYASLVPAVESGVEVGVVIAGNYERAVSAIASGEPVNDQSFLTTSAGRGGSPITGISKPAAHYNDVLLYQVTQGKALDAALKVIAMPFDQGEADQVNLVAKATYATALGTLQSDFETDASAITGQSEPIPLLVRQTAKDTAIRSDVPQAQLEVAQSNPKVFLLGPKYHIPHAGGGLHLSNVGQAWGGGYVGRAINDLRNGFQPRWLNPRSAVRRGSVIEVTFDVPSLPLVIDTATVPEVLGNGFRVTANSSTVTINSVVISGNKVLLNLANTPTGPYIVRYALDYKGTGMAVANQEVAVGNLRDSSPDTIRVSGVPRPLHNWAPHFELNVQEISE